MPRQVYIRISSCDPAIGQPMMELEDNYPFVTGEKPFPYTRQELEIDGAVTIYDGDIQMAVLPGQVIPIDVARQQDTMPLEGIEQIFPSVTAGSGEEIVPVEGTVEDLEAEIFGPSEMIQTKPRVPAKIAETAAEPETVEEEIPVYTTSTQSYMEQRAVQSEAEVEVEKAEAEEVAVEEFVPPTFEPPAFALVPTMWERIVGWFRRLFGRV